MSPTEAEMMEVTKLIESRIASAFARENGQVVETIDGNLGWKDLKESERQAILEFNVTWSGFTPEQEQDVIGNVISDDPPKDWMNGIFFERQAEQFDANLELEEMFRDMSIRRDFTAPTPGEIAEEERYLALENLEKRIENYSNDPFYERISREMDHEMVADAEGFPSVPHEVLERIDRETAQYEAARDARDTEEWLSLQLPERPAKTKSLSYEIETDTRAGKMRDAGEDYEAFLQQAAARMPANDNKEKGRDR